MTRPARLASAKAPPQSRLAPSVPETTHRHELLVSAAMAIKHFADGRAVIRDRLLTSDPLPAEVPFGWRAAVEIAALGSIELRDGGVRGLFRRRAVVVPAETRR